MLDAGELAAARADANLLLDTECTISVYSTTVSAGGGRDENWTPADAPVPARIAPVGGGEPATGNENAVRGGRIDARTTHVVTVPAFTAVTAQDRVEIDGDLFEVLAVRTRTNEIVRRLEVKTA